MSNDVFDQYDAIGVQIFILPSESGGFKPEVRRKKRPDESTGDSDWRWIRYGSIQSFLTRPEAMKAAVEMAEQAKKDLEK